MTLLEDLKSAAGYIANTRRASQKALALAGRLRDHASRLAIEAGKANAKALLPWSSGRTKDLVERINGGPVQP